MNSQAKACQSYEYSCVSLPKMNFIEKTTSNERREARLLIQTESQNLALKTDNFSEFRVLKYTKYNF